MYLLAIHISSFGTCPNCCLFFKIGILMFSYWVVKVLVSWTQILVRYMFCVYFLMVYGWLFFFFKQFLILIKFIQKFPLWLVVFLFEEIFAFVFLTISLKFLSPSCFRTNSLHPYFFGIYLGSVLYLIHFTPYTYTSCFLFPASHLTNVVTIKQYNSIYLFLLFIALVFSFIFICYKRYHTLLSFLLKSCLLSKL